jgi:hypothetical protein
MHATKGIFALAAGALMAPWVLAEEISPAPAPTAASGAGAAEGSTASLQIAGTIEKFGDQSFEFSVSESSSPTRYYYTNATEWVDQTGKAVKRESVASGAPVTLVYSKSPDGLLVSKVVVERAPAQLAGDPPPAVSTPAERGTIAETALQPSEAAGTVVLLGEDAISLRTQSSEVPVRYRFSTSTQWVDEGGNLLTRESIRAGVPAKVFYTKGTDGLLASKVVVRGQFAAIPSDTLPDPTTTIGEGRETVPSPAIVEHRETVVKPPARPIETTGVVANWGEDFVTLRMDGAATPVQFLYGDTTKWMDGAGRARSRQYLRVGMPVTIVYLKSEQGPVLSKVVLQRSSGPLVTEETEEVRPASRVIEERRSVVREKPGPRVIEKRRAVVEEVRPGLSEIERAEPDVSNALETIIIERPRGIRKRVENDDDD